MKHRVPGSALVWLLFAVGGCAPRTTLRPPTILEPIRVQSASRLPLPAPPPSEVVISPETPPEQSALPLVPPPSEPLSSPAESAEEPVFITSSWVGDSIQNVIGDIALEHKLQIFLSDLVRGTVTVQVENMPLETFLDYVTAPLGATFKKLGPRTYFVGPASARSPAFPRVSDAIVYPLQYVTVQQLRDLLPDWTVEYVRLSQTQPYAVVAAPLVYRDQILEIIRKIDRPPIQIVLSALVTEVTEEAGRQLRLGWDWQTIRSQPNLQGVLPPERLSEVTLSQQQPTEAFSHGLTVTRTGAYTQKLLATLESLVASGQAKIRANPAVVAQNGKEASMEIALEQYFKIETGTVAFPRVELQKVQSGVILKLTPQVAENGDITLTLEPSVDDVIAVGAEGLPVIQRRSVKSTVRVRNGELIVIGGLVEEREQEEIRKVPLLGSLPVLKFLFRDTKKMTQRKEVAILITPHILTEGENPTNLDAILHNESRNR